MNARWVAATVLAAALAGCASSPAPTSPYPPHAPRPPPRHPPPVDLNHDHQNPDLHLASWGVAAVAHLPTGAGAIPRSEVYNFDRAGDLLVASLGSFASSQAAPGYAALVPPMSLLVADVKDPAKPHVLSVTPMPGAGVESVAISDDAKFGFLGTEFNGVVGIWTLDLANPRQPVVVAFTPQPPEGPHNIRYGVIGQRHFVFASVSHVSTAGAAATGQQDPLPIIDLRVDVFEFNPAQPRLPMTLLSSYTAKDDAGVPGPNIVHDAVLEVHPITGQALLYVAHWARGVRIVDLTTPSQPKEIGKYVEPAPTDFLTIHTVKPHPGLIDGRHVSVATAQCAYTPGSVCVVRILDTTDPTNPVQLGTWTLPEEVHGSGYTTEIFDLADGKIVVPWAHGGTWALDISNLEKLERPEAVGYYFRAPDQPKPILRGNSPSANAVVLKDGYAIVADVYSGLSVLAFNATRPQA